MHFKWDIAFEGVRIKFSYGKPCLIMGKLCHQLVDKVRRFYFSKFMP